MFMFSKQATNDIFLFWNLEKNKHNFEKIAVHPSMYQ